MAEIPRDASALLPGLPQDLALLCFSKLPLHAVARCRLVSRSWASALSRYPAATRLPQPLACLCIGSVNARRESSTAWLLFFPWDRRCCIVPFFTRKVVGIHIYSSQMQVIPMHTNLLLVRSRLRFSREMETGISESDPCCDHHVQPGELQAFDLWQMKWWRELDRSKHVPPLLVDRWGFAVAHLGEHVYVAGGGGDSAAGRSAERFNIKAGNWEMLPGMIKERTVYPAGFAMGGLFYVVGGEFQPTTSTSGLTQSGEVYDPEKGEWTLVPGLWPEKMWGYGVAPYVVVVKEEAYAIGEGMEVMRLRAKGGWETAGRLPDACKSESVERWFFRLVSMGEDELWVVLISRVEECPWSVFSCRPYLSMEGLRWERVPFDVPFFPRQGIVTFHGVNV